MQARTHTHTKKEKEKKKTPIDINMDKNITTQQSESYIYILTYLKVFILFFDILLNLLIVGYEPLPNYLSLDT